MLDTNRKIVELKAAQRDTSFPSDRFSTEKSTSRTLPSPSGERCKVLCADDYGMTLGFSRAIQKLAESGKFSATSVMTNLPAGDSTNRELPALRRNLSVGLHLNLKAGEPLSELRQQLPGGRFPSLGQVLLASVTRRWDGALLRKEIMAQLDRFESAASAPPDHVDGHQHVHVFPAVRTTLLQCLQERYAEYCFAILLPAVRCF